jgi:hypothetical protein
MKKKQRGRPLKKGELTKSHTVSLLPSQKKYLVQKFGSLTDAIKTLIR